MRPNGVQQGKRGGAVAGGYHGIAGKHFERALGRAQRTICRGKIAEPDERGREGDVPGDERTVEVQGAARRFYGTVELIPLRVERALNDVQLRGAGVARNTEGAGARCRLDVAAVRLRPRENDPGSSVV